MDGSSKEAMDAADCLLTFVNRNGKAEFGDFVKRLETGHRTIQQAVLALFVEVIKANAAKGEYEFDARNAASVKLCKTIVERCPDELYLPFI